MWFKVFPKTLWVGLFFFLVFLQYSGLIQVFSVKIFLVVINSFSLFTIVESKFSLMTALLSIVFWIGSCLSGLEIFQVLWNFKVSVEYLLLLL